MTADREPRPRASRLAGPLSGAMALVLRALRASVRLEFHGDATIRRMEANDQRFILAFWHRHLLLMRYAYRGERITVLISRSEDGELATRVMQRLGVEVARGSTSRGGAAGLRELLRQARGGSDLAFTPDGPRGPARKVQPGVVLAAALTGFPIVPVALGASRARILSSWDRTIVPLPGSRVAVVYGENLRVASREEAGDAALELERRLNALEAESARLAGSEREPPRA